MKVTTDKAAYPQPDRLYLKGDLVLVLPGPFSPDVSGAVGRLSKEEPIAYPDGLFFQVDMLLPEKWVGERWEVHTSQVAGLEEAAFETVRSRKLTEMFDVR